MLLHRVVDDVVSCGHTRTLEGGSYEWGCEDSGRRRLECGHRGPRKSVGKASENNRYGQAGGEPLRERHGTRGRAGQDSRVPGGPRRQSLGPRLSDTHGLVSSRFRNPVRERSCVGQSHSPHHGLDSAQDSPAKEIQSSSTLTPECRARLFRMLDIVVALI